MNDVVRIILAICAGCFYAGLIISKVFSIHRTRQPVADQAASEHPKLEKRLRKILRFDLFRLIIDCAALLSFLLSNLCPAWFSLFPETDAGHYAAYYNLISITLLISIFVDWYPVCESGRLADGKTPPFSRFLIRQTIRVAIIDLTLTAVWCILLLLEPTEMHLAIKAAICILALILIRMISRHIQKRRKQPVTSENSPI